MTTSYDTELSYLNREAEEDFPKTDDMEDEMKEYTYPADTANMAAKATELGATGFYACVKQAHGPTNQVSKPVIDTLFSSYAEALKAATDYAAKNSVPGEKIIARVQA